MSLTLKEKLTILMINPKTGWINNQYSAYLIIAAAFVELIRLKKIELNNKKVHVLNTKRIRDALLDWMLEKIRQSKKEKMLKTWIKRFGMQGGKTRKFAGEQLQDHRIITIREVKILWLFPARKFYFRDTKIRNILLADITDMVRKQHTEDEDLFIILSFFVASKTLFKLFKDKTDRIKAKEVIKKLESENEIFKALSTVIREVKSAVATSVAVTAST